MVENSMEESLKALFLKQGEISLPTYKLNKLLSFNTELLEIATKIDCYLYYLEPDFIKALLFYVIPKQQQIPNINFIKSQGSEFDFLFERIQKHFHYTDEDMRFIKPLYLKLFQNKKTLLKLFRFYGIEKNKYMEFGLDFKQEKKWW